MGLLPQMSSSRLLPRHPMENVAAYRAFSPRAPQVVPLLLAGLATIVLVGFIVLEIGIPLDALLMAAETTVILCPVWHRCAHGSFDPFEPVAIATVAMLTMFVGRPLVDIVQSSYFHDGYDVRPVFTMTLLTVLSGTLAFQVGYACGPRKKSARKTSRAPRAFSIQRASAWAFVLASIAMIGTSIFIATSGGLDTLMTLLKGRATNNDNFFRSNTGYTYLAPNALIPAAGLLFLCGLKSGKRRFYLISLAASLPLVLVTVSRGDRSQLLPLAVMIPLTWYLVKNRRPAVASLLLVGLLFVIASSLIREARNTETKDKTASTRMLLDPSEAFLSMLAQDDDEMFDTLANEIWAVPTTLPFSHGCLITDVLVRALPRPLFPNKPLECTDAIIASLWPAHYGTTRAVQATSLVGNLYADSGVPTVVLGMFSLGFALRLCWTWFMNHRGDPHAILVYSLVPPFIVILLRGTIPDTIGRLFYTLIPLLLFQTLSRRRHPKSSSFLPERTIAS